MSCDIEEAKVWPDSKDPDDALPYAVNFEKECARKWEPYTDFTAGQRIRIFSPGAASGYEFEPTTPGRTGGTYPRFITSGTILDGSVVWTPRAISSASLIKTVSGTPTWTEASSGITISSTAVLEQKAIATLAGGTDGNDYDHLVKATFSDASTKTVVCILKVRRAQRVCNA